MKLPAGLGDCFKRDTDKLVEDERDGLSTAFQSEDYRTRRQTL